MKNRFFTQRLGKLHLEKDYLPESYSIQKLRLRDPNGNFYALYYTQFILFANYLKTKNLDIDQTDTTTILEAIETFSKQQPSEIPTQLILYYSTENLAQFLLDISHSSFDKDIISISGKTLKKNGIQNCVVMHQDGSIYIHPKIRGNLGKPLFSVSHSSLAPADGSALAFAGSFIHTQEKGWTLENNSGHYAPRVTQIRPFLEKLNELGLDLTHLTVKFWILNPEGSRKKYIIMEENAQEFLDRSNANMLRLAAI